MNKIIVLVTLSLLSSGCVVAAIGGAGAGGYYVGSGDRSVKTVASDASITAKINAEYVKSKHVSAFDINVDTYNGVVTLNGNVSSYKVEEEAIRIAESIQGVRKVISKLTIAGD